MYTNPIHKIALIVRKSNVKAKNKQENNIPIINMIASIGSKNAPYRRKKSIFMQEFKKFLSNVKCKGYV